MKHEKWMRDGKCEMKRSEVEEKEKERERKDDR